MADAPRQFRLAVPAEPTGKRRLPLILNFHGRGGTDVEQAAYSQLEEKGPARGFVVVTPNAGDPPLWNRPDTTSNFVEASEANLAFTRAIIDAVAERFCVDKNRVYATGYSNGAGMSAYLGCTSKPRLAAIAPVAGINLAKPCPHGPPVSVIAFHGTADPNVPYSGGRTASSPHPGALVPSVESALDAWAHRDGCSSKPSHRVIGSEVERITYRSCDRGYKVVFYGVAAGGHTWPGSFEVPMRGHVTQDINASDLILAYFSHHPPPAKNRTS